MDPSNKVDVEAVKTYIREHSTLTEAQKNAAMAAADSCLASPPKLPEWLVPTQSMTVYICFDRSMNSNVSSQPSTLQLT